MIKSRISDRSNPLVLEFELDNDNGNRFANYSFRGRLEKYTKLGVVYYSDLYASKSGCKYTEEYIIAWQINTRNVKYSMCTDFSPSDMRSVIGFVTHIFYLVYERR